MEILAYSLYILAKILYIFAIGGLLFLDIINKKPYPKAYRYLFMLSVGNLSYALAMIIVGGSKIYIILLIILAWIFMRFYKQRLEEYKLTEKNKDDL